MKTLVFAACSAACLAVGATVCTNTWNVLTANTPIAAYDWSEASNWKTPALGAPDGWNAKATLGSATAPVFIRTPDDLKLSAFSVNNYIYLLGNMTVSGYPGIGTGSGSFTTDLGYGGIIFGDIRNTKVQDKTIYMGGQIAGHFRPGKWYDGTAAGYAHTSRFVMRCDLFADDTNPVREGPYHWSGNPIENGGFWLVGPRGADAQDCAWTLTDQSPYLQYAGEGTHGVVPGTVVTGDGIPSGTFVKYVFNKSGWIELSNPVTASGAKTLHFSAITPTVRQYMPEYWGHNGNRATAAIKYREQDICEFYIGTFKYTDPADPDRGTSWGLDDTMVANGYLPGEIVITNLTYSTAVDNRRNTLQTVNLTFEKSCTEPTADAKPGIYWTFADGKPVARLTITRDNVFNIGNFKNLKGTLVKRGTGTLGLAMSTALASANKGTVKIDEGTLAFTKNTVIASEALAVANVEIAAGATLKIPAEGMTVVSLKAAAGAMVEGPGTLTVPGSLDGIPTPVGGAIVELKTPDVSSRAAALNGIVPWYDLDASDFGTAKMTTRLENGTNFVTRWDDSCGGGHYAVRHVSGTTLGADCWIRENATNGMPFVDLGPFVCSNFTGPGVLNGKSRALKIMTPDGQNYYGGNEGDTNLKWTGPKKPAIRAAFFVVNSDQGGGSLLGAEGSSYFGYGLIHDNYRPESPIISFDSPTYDTNYGGYAADGNIDNGSLVFRVNGRSVYPRREPFSGGFDVITFRGSRYSSLLGTFWQGGSSATYQSSANGLAYGEVICLTNEIDDVRMKAIEAFLQKKWFGNEVPGYFYRGAVVVGANSTLDVSAGSDRTAYASSVGGAGTVEGDVKVDESGVFTVDVGADGLPVVGLTVNGAVTLPANGSVAFTGNVRKLKPGVYTLMTATSVTGDVSGWTVGASRNGQSAALALKDNSLVLTVTGPGIVIMVK